ncbi:MAG: AraC family transcriptional regulator [Capsulimonadaceae bacterium]|nr:AraC family transcriptional regulator [Capsulimonadaceae bacterium]
MAQSEIYARQRLEALQEELHGRIEAVAQADGTLEPVKGLHLNRYSRPSEPIHGVSEPSICILAQGAKILLLGDDRLTYRKFQYLIVTAELPYTGQIVDASPECPYLGVRLDFDPALVGSVIVEAGQVVSQNCAGVKAMAVNTLDEDLLDAVVRYVRLIDSPGDARVLAPMIMREIVYRLLLGDQGARLRHIAMLTGYTDSITTAIEKLRNGFDKPLRMDDVAGELGMSPSSFYSQFKAVTAMSPLQFQKQLRLQEARRLLLNGDFDAAGAGFKVGYDDASQFNREYKRFFGAPPMSDVRQMRNVSPA